MYTVFRNNTVPLLYSSLFTVERMQCIIQNDAITLTTLKYTVSPKKTVVPNFGDNFVKS